MLNNKFSFSSKRALHKSKNDNSTDNSRKRIKKDDNSFYKFTDSDQNEINAAIRLQKITRGYFSRQRLATHWVNDQLNATTLTPTKLLFKIVKKQMPVPTNLSLHLVLNSLFDKVRDLNVKDNYGGTPLHRASFTGDLNIVEYLVKAGADIESKDKRGNTPLERAIFKGKLSIVKYLIKEGADVNAPSNCGSTPLSASCCYGPFEAAKILIEHGANVDAANQYGTTPLYWALRKNHWKTAQLLIEHGADLNKEENGTRLVLFFRNTKLGKFLNIVDHLDNNDSTDTLTSNIEGLTTEQVKDYYNTNKDQIDSLMKHRKESQLALSIVHTPHNVVIPDNFDKEKIITYSLVLMKANKYLRYLPALCPFPVKENSQWNFLIEDFQFISLQDLGKLAQVNKEFRDAFSLIRKNDGIQILIRSNQYRLAN